MQKKISGWLKILTAAIGITGAAFFTALTVFVLSEPGGAFFLNSSAYLYVGLLWYTYLLCLLILRQFWKVCVEIGNDNSFSVENAVSFERMSAYAVLMCAGYLVGIVACVISGNITVFYFFRCMTVIVVSVTFCVICRCLAVLIRNAHEVKRENDLTI